MDNIQPNQSQLQKNLKSTEGRDKVDSALSSQSRTYRSKSSGNGLNPAVRASRAQHGPKMPLGAALPQRSASSVAYNPTKASSQKLLQEQATAHLPPTLEALPPYRHIFIGVQFDEFYAPLYKDLDAQAKEKLPTALAAYEEKKKLDPKYSAPTPTFKSVRKSIPCERLGRHLIFNGFALVRDFITSDETRSKKEFQGREALAMEVLDNLYAFTLAKIEAGNFTLQEFVEVNLLMALLVDWRKGLMTEFHILDSAFRLIDNLPKEEKDKRLNFQAIFDRVNHALHDKDFAALNLLQDIINPCVFATDLLTKGTSIYVPGLVDYVRQRLYEYLPNHHLYLAYSNSAGGIAESRFVDAFHAASQPILTTFDCTAGYTGKKDASHPSRRFEIHRDKDSSEEKAVYKPHANRISAVTNIDHDYNHVASNMRSFSSMFKHLLKFPYPKCVEPIGKLTRGLDRNPLDENQKAIIDNIHFFLAHEIGNLHAVYRGSGLEKSGLERKSTEGWKEFLNDNTLNRNDLTHPKDALRYVVQNAGNLLSNNYSHYVGNLDTNYSMLYRDMELMLHEDMVPFPEDGEKKFTYKPLKDKDGKPLLPTFQQLFDNGINVLKTQLKGSKLTEALEVIEAQKDLRAKWKAIPKAIRNHAKAEALSDGYKRLFETAWDIIDKNLTKEDFAEALESGDQKA
jgi:hypothetical protein